MKEIERKLFVAFVVLMLPASVAACPLCRAQAASGIYDQDFFFNLFVILLPVALLTAIGVGLYQAENIRRKWLENWR